MNGLCSVHTHSTMCDGTDSLSEMAWAAYEAGAVSFGASGHSHTPIPEDEGCVLPADMTVYREEVLRLREEFAGRMDVLLGVELDSRADVTPEGLDYWIGSVHYVTGPDGEPRAVDWNEERLVRCCLEKFGGDFLALAREYYGEVQRMAARRPTILGHLDLIAKYNEGYRLFDERAASYRAAALEALHAADPAVTLLEVNTGGMSRGYRKSPYPAIFLLREWRSMGGGIIFTDDAHSADAIGFGYAQAAELAREAGFDRSTLLTRSGWEERPL
ncbi:histidinol-phosphatase HisJ family protein [uncultured Oscillibacter sp.]|uniref:histidinol-phosphatase HisJ family protein n=1 Tax=uncultured Oscillibacter sp. TaxID=876091 RepID=UPI0025FB0505|nr:histidinol-phosphatase HisJ family protein [uncultured Oscillibacter sp.]